MAKISTEFQYNNTIVLFDNYHGKDTYYVNGKQVISTIINAGSWGPGDNSSPWYIDAGAGNDKIDASALIPSPYWYGTNTLVGGSGMDQIFGSPVSDKIDGGSDSDLIQAGYGDDTVIYDPRDSYVDGSAGYDTIDASSFSASVRGQGVTVDLTSTKDAYVGFENIIGSAYADKLTGDDEGNSLVGGAGNDSLYGSGGGDFFDGGVGADAMYGGAGDDTFIVATGTDHPVEEIVSGGDGDDGIVFNSTTPGDTLTLHADDSVERAVISSPYFTDGLNIDAFQVPDTIAIYLYGDDSGNHLTGNGAANFISGLGGADIIDGGVGGDIIYADDGNDTVIHNASYSFVDGGFGTDSIDATGAAATDTNGTGVTIDLSSSSDQYVNFENITGSAYNDTLNGDGGRQVMDGGSGNDNLTGGPGSDTFVLSPGNDIIQDFSVVSGYQLTMDFENISPYGWPTDIGNYYDGFYWNYGVAFAPGVYDPQSGISSALHSGSSMAFSYYGTSVESTNSGDFDLVDGYFSTETANPYAVTIVAYDDGQEVGSATAYVTGGSQVRIDFENGVVDSGTLEFGYESSRFTSVDRIKFLPWIGNLGIDDLTLNTNGLTDKIDVPDGTNIDELISQAQSDGNGGTILTHSTGALTLVGVEQAALTPDLFV